LGHKTGTKQLLQMKGQGGGRDAQSFGNQARSHPVWTRLYQQAKRGQPMFVRKSRKGCDSFFGGHYVLQHFDYCRRYRRSTD